MVVLPNIDGVIWHQEYRMLDIVKQLSTTGKCTIDLNSEGPCAESLGLYDLLDYVCDKFSFAKDSIEIVTCNQLESHPEYIIKIQPPLYIDETQDFYHANRHRFSEKYFPTIKPIGFFVGRSNFLRLHLASEINHHYGSRAELTFHYDRSMEFHRPHIGVEKLISNGIDMTTVVDSVEFLSKCPKKLSDEKISYPILTPAHLDICKYYRGIFCEIVAETYSMGKSFYPTEKIWRPLMMKTPFIVQGPMYYLDNLKKLGFKTFDRWWDEGHQHDPYDYQPTAILEVVRYIMSLSTKELQDVYEDMIPTLQHNHDRFMELRSSDFGKVFGYQS